ncbi:methyltransferase cognate corrinoid protein [Methanohalobium evestigatum Z-7303]|uniref:Methyltransferase cognate corrinoid protein n=1 Tax=Methanohalobium evestigatum (strain ATCC BAA-1072 / DSM 3721 / NBRC 107634 / OCM 161 / Z-7303) TaxID=644295 RepID=D7E9D7_METEZ|nr:methyltransferase cognate corrinoid protein [Methanohalobium evestigatum]ADI74209.1 methyltransferase cognate corrinoid protein [Methanohalobium evestigatum Z-7303]
MVEKEEQFEKLKNAIINQDIEGCKNLTKEALDAGLSPIEIVNKGLTPGMKVVGDRFENGEAFLPQIMMAAKAMQGAMEYIEPELEKGGGEEERVGTAITFVQEGDIHDIGHRLVTTMLQANGFDIVDLGTDVPDDTVLEEIEKNKDKKLLLVGSALMTTSMLGQKELMNLIRESGVRDYVKIMLGGAPVTQKWIDEIGADATAENAAEAARVGINLMQK